MHVDSVGCVHQHSGAAVRRSFDCSLSLRQGQRRGGLAGAAYLESLGPVYSRYTDFVGDGDDWEDIDLSSLSGAANFTLLIAVTRASAGIMAYFNADSTDLFVNQSTAAPTLRFGIGSGKYAGISAESGLVLYTALFRGGQPTNPTRMRLWRNATEQTGVNITHVGTIPASVPEITAARLGAMVTGQYPIIATVHLVALYAADLSANLDAMHAAANVVLGV